MKPLEKISKERCDTISASIMALAKEIEPNFTLSGKEDFYINLYLYFKNDSDCPWNLSKGIIVTGNIGTGKTLAFKIMQKMFQSFGFMSCRYIVRDFLTEGTSVLDRYGRNSFYVNPSGNKDLSKPIHWCFDDLGMEETDSKLYGNSTNVMREILTDRYDMFQQHGIKTFATANADVGIIEKIYGERIRDRFREMLNYVTLTGKSLRK